MAAFIYPTNQTSYASPMHDSAKRRHTRFSELHVLPSGQNTPFSHAAMVVFDEASGSKGADDDKDDQSDISAHLPSIARMIERIEMEEKEALERGRVDNAANPITGPERIDLTDEESPRSSAVSWSCELAPMHKQSAAQLFAQAAAARHITPMPMSPTTPIPSGNRQWSPSEERRARKPGQTPFVYESTRSASKAMLGDPLDDPLNAAQHTALRREPYDTKSAPPGCDNEAHAIPVASTPVDMVSSPSWGTSSTSVEGHRRVINSPPSGLNGSVPLPAPFRPSATRTSDNRPAKRRHRASTAPGVAATSDELVPTSKRRKGETSGGLGRGAQPALHPAQRLRTRAPGQENKEAPCATPMTLAAGSTAQPSVAPAPRRDRGARVQASKPSPTNGSTETLDSGNVDEDNDIYTVKRLLARWGGWYFVAWEDGSHSWEPKRNMLNQKMVDDFEATYEGLSAGIEIVAARIRKGRKQWRVHWHGRPTKEDCWIDNRRIDWARIGRI